MALFVLLLWEVMVCPAGLTMQCAVLQKCRYVLSSQSGWQQLPGCGLGPRGLVWVQLCAPLRPYGPRARLFMHTST